MKKRINKILIFVILFILIGINTSLGVEIDSDIVLYQTTFIQGEDTNDHQITEHLRKRYGDVRVDQVTGDITVITEATIKGNSENNKVQVTLGDGNYNENNNKDDYVLPDMFPITNKSETWRNLEKDYGFEDSLDLKNQNGETVHFNSREEIEEYIKQGNELSWDIVIKCTDGASFFPQDVYRVKATQVLTGEQAKDFINDLMNNQPNDSNGEDNPNGGNEQNGNEQNGGDVQGVPGVPSNPFEAAGQYAADNITDEFKLFCEQMYDSPVKTILTICLDIIKGIGDLFQSMANLFQTGWQHWDVTYTREQITGTKKSTGTETEADHTKLDGYVDLNNKNNYIGQKELVIDDTEKNYFYKYGYVKETEIPVIAVDLYTIAANKVDLAKANFLVKTGNENEVWLTIRNFVASVIHGLMYITIAFLTTGIIIYGIQIVSRTYQTPQEKAKKIKGMEKFVTGLIMLVGTIFLEAICLYASDMILGEVAMQDTYEGPIKIITKTKNGETSFSTTPTGYFRYMADITNVELYQTKALFVGAYLILSISNLLCAIGMVGRMIVMMALAILHFWLVLKFVLQSSTANTMEYRKWITSFAGLSLIQVVVAIIARFLLEGIKVN